MTRNAGQHVYPRGGVNVQIQIICPQAQRVRCSQRKGRLAQLKGVNTQQQVVHDRVTDKDRVHDQGLVDLGLCADLCKERVHALAHCGCHFLRAAGVHHGIADPAHQVLTKADLWVHHAGGGDDLAGVQIAQVRGNRG